MEMNKDMLLQLSEAFKMIAQSDQKAVGTIHSGITLHGPGGIFSTFGLERDVISAHMEPYGLISKLPLAPSMDTDPRFASVTGVTDSNGDQPSNACEDAPTAYLKGCNLTARFGLIRFDTNDIEWDTVLTRYNRGDFMDLQLLGGLIGDEAMRSGIVPSDLSQTDILNIVTLVEMLVVGVQTERELVRQSWQGNVNLANEFPGLDSQISTGQMDADIAGKLCSALDSDVKNFGYDDVCGTNRDIAEYLASMMWYLEFNASRMKLNPVKFKIVVRPELWFELSACWPCRYMTNRCRDNAGVQVAVINDELNVTLRDKMREGLQIPINGKWYDVEIDDGVYEHNAGNNANLIPGEFASTIYAVPLTILGGFPVTYRQHLDYKSTVATGNAAPFAQYRKDFWTDGGAFSWAYDGLLWCYKLGLKTEQRIILRTPQLAGRIDYVKYVPTQHLRSPFPDSDYFRDGGVSTRPANRTSYAVWSNAANNVVPS
jgi:hypothetical protein